MAHESVLFSAKKDAVWMGGDRARDGLSEYVSYHGFISWNDREKRSTGGKMHVFHACTFASVTSVFQLA